MLESRFSILWNHCLVLGGFIFELGQEELICLVPLFDECRVRHSDNSQRFFQVIFSSNFHSRQIPVMPPKKPSNPPLSNAPLASGRRMSMRLGGLQDPGNRTSRRESKAQSPAETTSYLKIDPTLIQRTGLSVEQLQELIEIFQLVDVDNGGTISTDELEMLMKTLGLRATQVYSTYPTITITAL